MKSSPTSYSFFAARIGTTGGERLEINVDGEPFISASIAELRTALGLRSRSHSPRRGPRMTRVLYQGVEWHRRSIELSSERSMASCIAIVRRRGR